jgi:hypothetical protein
VSRGGESFFNANQKSVKQIALARHLSQPQNPLGISGLITSNDNESPMSNRDMQHQMKVRRHTNHKIANDPATANSLNQNCVKLQSNFQYQNLVVLQKPNLMTRIFENKELNQSVYRGNYTADNLNLRKSGSLDRIGLDFKKIKKAPNFKSRHSEVSSDVEDEKLEKLVESAQDL